MVNNFAAGWISFWMEGMFYSMLEVPFRRLVWVDQGLNLPVLICCGGAISLFSRWWGNPKSWP